MLAHASKCLPLRAGFSSPPVFAVLFSLEETPPDARFHCNCEPFPYGYTYLILFVAFCSIEIDLDVKSRICIVIGPAFDFLSNLTLSAQPQLLPL